MRLGGTMGESARLEEVSVIFYFRIQFEMKKTIDSSPYISSSPI